MSALFGRRKAHFEVSVSPEQLRRGEQVEATLTIDAPDKVGDELKVGLVCSELYDYWGRKTDGEGNPMTARVTGISAAFELWEPAVPSERIQTFRFRVPDDAPFSHEGASLKYRWRISARDSRRRRKDRNVSQPVEVLP